MYDFLPSPAYSLATPGEMRDSYATHNLASINQCETPLGLAFFSDKNFADIQIWLRDEVKRRTGYTIDRQSDESLSILMRKVYVLNARHQSGGDVSTEVGRLNGLVMREILPDVMANLKGHLGYVRDASRIPTPLDRPRNVSIKGDNTFELFHSI